MLPFIDLKAQYARIKDTVDANLKAVLERASFILGPENAALEERLARFAGSRHALGCASGTDALLMALMALDIGPGDSVLTTPFTFVATAETIALAGATPVFVDVDPETFNIDPDLLDQALRSAGAAKALISVDLFGLAADYDRILPWAESRGLPVIVDAAQAFGATIQGKSSVSMGTIGCTSFFPAKPLGCYGDGGAVFTESEEIRDALASIRVHGQGTDKYENVRIGINGRLDTVQAAVLLAKMDVYEDELAARQAVADVYAEVLDGSGLVLQRIPEGYVSVWAQYSVLARDGAHRTACQEALKAADVPTAVYYPIPLHLQKAFAHLGYKPGDMPVSEDLAGRIFSLPMHPYLERADQEHIGNVLKKLA